jgi:hypothetical protein
MPPWTVPSIILSARDGHTLQLPSELTYQRIDAVCYKHDLTPIVSRRFPGEDLSTYQCNNTEDIMNCNRPARHGNSVETKAYGREAGQVEDNIGHHQADLVILQMCHNDRWC